MNPRERLLNPIWSAAPIQQLTPTQCYFKDTIGTGRTIPSDFSKAHATLNQITVHPDGTCDSLRLDVHAGGWVNLGGRGAPDVAAGRAY